MRAHARNGAWARGGRCRPCSVIGRARPISPPPVLLLSPIPTLFSRQKFAAKCASAPKLRQNIWQSCEKTLPLHRKTHQWCHVRVVRYRSAKPFTAVRIRLAPPKPRLPVEAFLFPPPRPRSESEAAPRSLLSSCAPVFSFLPSSFLSFCLKFLLPPPSAPSSKISTK